MEDASGRGPNALQGAISGNWHLVDHAADEVNIPAHRMDLRLKEDSGNLRAAVLSRVTGEEMLMIHSVSFDGEVLKLQMVAPPDRQQTEMPFLVMRATGDKLQGHWQLEGIPMGPGLKLVRARA